MPKRYFLHLAYCGTHFNGWQSQINIPGTRTVQGILETSLSVLTRQTISVTGCGRTDTGVHAADYYAHVDSDVDLTNSSFLHKLNSYLPQDIAVYRIFEVDSEVHARFSAVSRSYTYYMHARKMPFAPYSYFYPYGQPDLNLLQKTADMLLAYQDFNSFCKTRSDVRTTNCRISHSSWEKTGDFTYEYHITADRFLRGMVRLIVGMCLQVARGKLDLDQAEAAVQNGIRTGQDWSVPPQGLFLSQVKYKEF
jgi:tRNA pseudouridine38-40 synthase